MPEVNADQQKFNKDATAVLANPTIQNFTAVAGEVQPLVGAFPEIVKETKAGYKTTEFWITLASAAAIGFGAVPTPHDAKGYALAALAGIYAIARGLAKKGVPSIEPSPVAIAPAATDADVVAGAPE